MSEPLLQVRGLGVEFDGAGGRPAVDALDLDLARGEALGIVGESGSGKSVTALAIMRLLADGARIRAGAVGFDGCDLLALPPRAMQAIRGRRIGMIFQEPMTSLHPAHRVGAQVAEPLRLHLGMSRPEAWRRAVALLERVGIVDAGRRAQSYPHQLSGGQRQRVMIAQAIACGPDLLIADEPTTALDVTTQRQVLDLLDELRRKHGMALLLISHDLDLVARVCDRVVVMRHGQALESGRAGQVVDAPRHPYTRMLLACRPRPRSECRRLAVVDGASASGSSPDVAIDAGTAHALATAIHVEPTGGLPPSQPGAVLSPPLLEVHDLVVRHAAPAPGWFRTAPTAAPAVAGVSLSLRRGATLGIVGESGSGKTTLARGILRLVEPEAGSVRLDGIDVLAEDRPGLRRLRKRMQIVFQDPMASLNPTRTVLQALDEPLRLHGIGGDRADREARAAELLRRVGLDPASLGRYPHAFSGGQRQRIGIARALAVEPDLIVCDESVSALDVSVQAQVLNLLRDLQDEYGLSYLFISHDIGVIRFMADDIAVMQRGRVVEAGPADALCRDPADPYTRALLQAAQLR
jgi:peptide/nickel transport system ATP-binding protein